MKVFQILNENFPFHSNTTEMPFYDNMMENPDYFEQQKGLKSKLIKMSPDDYIDAVGKSKNVTREQMLSHRDPKKIEEYAKLMIDGHKFPILTLDYSHGKQVSQEGLHRSFAAIKAGVTQVPVLVVELTDEEKRNRK